MALEHALWKWCLLEQELGTSWNACAAIGTTWCKFQPGVLHGWGAVLRHCRERMAEKGSPGRAGSSQLRPAMRRSSFGRRGECSHACQDQIVQNVVSLTSHLFVLHMLLLSLFPVNLKYTISKTFLKIKQVKRKRGRKEYC